MTELNDFLLSAKTIQVDGTGTSVTVHTPGSGKRFVCNYLFVESTAGVNLTVQSGSNDLTAAIPFTAAEDRTFSNSGFPVFCGVAVDEALVIGASGSTTLTGFAVIVEVQNQ